ncbi:MAG: hypothetical protein ABII06_00380 [Pseudomonadota bacterium]
MMKKIGFLLCLFFVVSCAHQRTPIPQYPVIPVEKAVVCFYQPQSFYLVKPLTVTVHHGDRILRTTTPGTFWFYECDPGTHYFWVEAKNRAAISLDVAPQRHYFVKYGLKMKGILNEVYIERVSALDGDLDIRELEFLGSLR